MALSRFPFPTLKGDKLRAYYQIKELSRNHEIYLLCLSDELISESDFREVSRYCALTEIISLGYVRRFCNLASGMFSSIPFQVHYFKHPHFRQRASQIIEEYSIDICYVQLIRMGENLKYSDSCLYFLDYMDAFSAGMRKRAERSTGILKPIYLSEARRLKRYESEITAHYQGFSVISQADKEELPALPIHIIPNGISEQFLEYPQIPSSQKDIDVIFTGNMNYHSNVEAATYLCEKVFPLLKIKNKKFSIFLAGTDPGAEVKRLASEEITVTGFVPDLRPYLTRAKVAVAPLFFGSGLQNKLLEAMAIGLPVITSPLANASLCAPADAIRVCQRPEEFAETITDLIKNPEKAEEIGQKGKNFVMKSYNWTYCTELLEKAMKNAKNEFVNLPPE